MAEPEFKLQKTPQSFGGKTFWEGLFDVGLIARRCPMCGREARVVMYPSRNYVPKACCPLHGRKSCLSTGFFAHEPVKEPAKFVHFGIGYVERASSDLKRIMTGMDADTETKFRKIIEETMDEYIDQKVRSGEMLLGGDGKVVEIDEMEITVNKNHKGRLPSKKIRVLGMVEVDAPVVDVPDASLRRAVRVYETQNALELQQEREGRRRRRPTQLPVPSPFQASQAPMEVEVRDGDELGVRPTRPSNPADERKAIDACIKRVNSMFLKRRTTGREKPCSSTSSTATVPPWRHSSEPTSPVIR